MKNVRTQTIKKALLFLLLMAVLMILSTSAVFASIDFARGTEWPVIYEAGDSCTGYCYEDGTVVVKGTGVVKKLPVNAVVNTPQNYKSVSISKVVLDSGITGLGSYAGSNLSITSIDFPPSVTNIGSGAFFNCDNLQSLTIPATVKVIEDGAFSQCDNLECVTIAGNYNEGDSDNFSIFSSCSKLKKAVILDGVTKIAGFTFQNCPALSDVTLPDTLTRIGEAAFCNCSALAEIVITESVTSIGGRAFEGCEELTDIVIPEGVTSIEYSTFKDCFHLQSITLPTGLRNIGNYAFSYCSDLTSIILPERLTTIGSFAFNYCSMLPSVVISRKVEKIEPYTFYQCSNLYSITIPKSVTSVGEWAFSGCSLLRFVYFTGTEHEWNQMEIDQSFIENFGVSNHELLDATRIYNYGVHFHEYTSAVTTPATCTEKGVMTYTCSCGDTYTKEIEIDSTNHAALNENGDCPRCGKHIKDVERPTEPTTKPSEEKPAEKLNFFQRIIQWFRNLFAKLFGR